MTELDNPAWHALAGEQRPFGLVGERAARYRADISPIAAVADDSPAALAELAGFAKAGEYVALFREGELPAESKSLWRLATVVSLSQWVCPAPPAPSSDAVAWLELGEDHAADMYRLAKETDPGPFERYTHRLGSYIGVIEDGQLIAMAGERICMPGFREVSAVCTTPEYTGRGYARALVSELVRRQQRAGCVPFLHVRTGSPAEAQAKRAYRKVGFVQRMSANMSVLVRL